MAAKVYLPRLGYNRGGYIEQGQELGTQLGCYAQREHAESCCGPEAQKGELIETEADLILCIALVVARPSGLAARPLSHGKPREAAWPANRAELKPWAKMSTS